MDPIYSLTTTTHEVDGDLRAVDRLVRSLGSSLDVTEIAARSVPILAEELGCEQLDVLIIDEIDRALEVVASLDPKAELPQRGTLSPEFTVRLRGADAFFEVPGRELPARLALHGNRVAFRLRDGDRTVGLVLLPGHHVVDTIDPHEEVLARTIGGLIGSLVSRAQVHQALQHMTDRLDGARRLQQHVLDHVSHEFNTPLMIMKSSAEFADTDDPLERSAFLDMHRQALDRLEDLVQGVLEVAHDRSEARPRTIDFGAFVSAVIDPVLDALPWRRAQLQTHVSLPSEGSFLVDVDGMESVLEHLLRNAWSFAVESGGRAALLVHVGSSAAPACDALAELVDALEDDRIDRYVPAPCVAADRLVIRVVDSGIGIPEDELEHVFEPFVQAANSPLRGISGAGMGLPATRKRIEAQSGSIRLSSELGFGTCVHVEIPLL